MLWSYLAQFLSIGTGIITLPLILNKLSGAEIGLNYILITIGSIVALVDLGFAPQFARNFTYIFSGAQEIVKEGIGRTGETVNYRLLSSLLKTARHIYGILGGIAILLLLSIGTPYVYTTTDGFKEIPNALGIWIIYALGVFFQIYYSYYFSMLLGAGLIKEQKIAVIGNKVLYIILLSAGLFLGWGLISVSLAQMISPFLGRFLSHKFFYTENLKRELSPHSEIERQEIITNLKILWYNAKRNAVQLIGSYAILRSSMFIAGLYMSLTEFASYGLMVQLTGLLGSVGNTMVVISQPKFASLRTQKQYKSLLSSFSLALLYSYGIFIVGSIIFVLFGPQLLVLIKSNASLPSTPIVIIYCIVIFLEYNHASFASLISSNNKVPFAPASVITGLCVCLGTFLSLSFTHLGILGLVIVQGVCQGAYQNWKWPQYALREFNISYFHLIDLGFQSISSKISKK